VAVLKTDISHFGMICAWPFLNRHFSFWDDLRVAVIKPTFVKLCALSACSAEAGAEHRCSDSLPKLWIERLQQSSAFVYLKIKSTRFFILPS
jgi:hypothetical protein